MDEILSSLNIILHEFTLDQLHFLRAQWFYAFIPLLLFLLLSLTKQRSNKNWKSVIDPQLMPFVLRPSSETPRRRYPLLLVLIAASLCITALAGPVYKKLPQPVYQEKSSLVILLDLSQSMNATDVKPSRLARAKLELLDILKARKTGQTALIVYAADAFVVTPLTDDNATIANMVPSLETDMMPAQGSNFTAALKKAVSLLSQAGVINGDILAITDDIRQKDEPAIQQINTQGHRLSIFGIGTPGGGPIPLDGGFLQDRNGAIVIAKLDSGKLQNYALQAGGLYTGLSAGDRDVEKLSRLFQSAEVKHESKDKGGDKNRWADQWREEGYWLLLPLLLLSALWARRGWLAMISFMLPLILISGLGITPQTAYAAEPSLAADQVGKEVGNEASNQPGNQTVNHTGNDEKPLLDTRNLWSTPDQKAMRSFKAGDNERAAQQFQSPAWKASAYYRKGDYQAAADILKGIETSDAYYNKGNALAKLGKYQEAIKAYDKAIELDKTNKDAAYNREQVKQALKKQQSEQDQSQQDQQEQDKQKQDKSEQDQSEQQKSDDNKSDSDKSEQQQSDQDKSDQKKSDKNESSQQDDSQNQNNPQQDADKNEKNNQSSSDNKDQQNPSEEQSQQAEDEELKNRDAEAEAKKQEQEKQQYEQDSKKDQDKKDQEKQNLDKEDAAQKNQDGENRDDQKKQQDILENTPEDDQSEGESEKKPAEIEVNPTEASITEQEKAAEQWLKRIPDDPGGLLRRKFLYQYKNIPNQQDSDEPW